MGLFDGILDFVSDIPIVGDIIDTGKDLLGGANNFLGSQVGQFATSSYAADKAYQGQSESNQMNMQLMREQSAFNQQEAATARGFNAEEAIRARDWNAGQAVQARDFNMQEAGKQRDWTEYMSNTQWQRAVGDLSKAGLNPMLAYSKGGNAFGGGATASGAPISGPAASGSGASAGALARFENPAGAGIGAFATAAQARKVLAELDNVQALADRTRAETEKIRAETSYTSGPLTASTTQNTRTSSAQEANISQDTQLKAEQVREVMARVIQIGERTKLTRLEMDKVQADIWNAIQTGRKLVFDTRNSAANAQLSELAIPHMQNMSNAEETWFKKYVSPFLPDFLRGSVLFNRFPMR